MRKLRLSLLEQLEQMETEQYQTAMAIIEIHRRLYTLAQVKSWSLPGAGRPSTSSEKPEGMQVATGLIGELTPTMDELIQGYCLKCKSKRGIKNATQLSMKNGRPRTQGFCVACNTRISTITKAF